VIAYFTGVYPPETAGHYCRTPRGKIGSRDHAPSPWSDGPWYPLGDDASCREVTPGHVASARAAQAEGIARVVVREGWTLVHLWDRSADRRGGSHASFAFDYELAPHAAVEHARIAFPLVWARIDAHLAELGIPLRVEAAP
jgi:hypothetical protein